MSHVKPHGALYNKAAEDKGLAMLIGEVVKSIDPLLPIMCLAGSQMITVLESFGLKAMPESFADRTYEPDGTLRKRSYSNALINNPRLICEAKDKVGSQSLVAVLDIKRHGLLKKKHYNYKSNGSIKTNLDILEFSKELESYGIGEIILNSIDNDGKQMGYDFEMSDSIIPHLNIPITLLGGAGNFSHLNQANKKYGIVGLGGGSIFVFKGKYRAVLIQYPNKKQKQYILD